MTQLGLTPESRQVVLNFTDTRAGLSVADVEATIGTAVDVRLPRSAAAQASVNQGLPLLQNAGRDQMTKQLRGLVNRFAPVPLPKREPKQASRKKAAKKAPAPEPKPRRAAAGHWSRGRWASAS